ncbi:MAG: FAD-dependent oxidoreductase [Candidatus Harrisonbacteria bacterium]|nr:FAD-dependent oxidoreductase [Candidatus Harrisonbacteria bacterium]
MYDLVIAGGGPAGVAAGVYAARKKINTLFIADSFGGQSLPSAGIQNWIGTKEISGYDLARALEEHLRAQEDIEIVDNDRIAAVQKITNGFTVHTTGGKTYETKTLFVATGSRRRRMGVPGEDRLDGKGVSYCSTCDAPIFKDKVVAVIGGGNAGLEAVVDLFPYASQIYLLERGAAIRGDAVTEEKVKAHPKVTIILNAETKEVLGDAFVSGLRYASITSGAVSELALEGVFVEIGSVPNGDFLKGLVEFNKFGEIVVDPRTQRASVLGIWAAGDVTDVLYKQNNVAAGDAIKAVLDIYDYLNKGGAQ